MNKEYDIELYDEKSKKLIYKYITDIPPIVGDLIKYNVENDNMFLVNNRILVLNGDDSKIELTGCII